MASSAPAWRLLVAWILFITAAADMSNLGAVADIPTVGTSADDSPTVDDGTSSWWAGFKSKALSCLAVAEGLRNYGWAGYATAFLIIVGMGVVLFPPFDILVGWTSLTVCFVYGFYWGFANVWAAKTGGSVLAFVLFQRVGRRRGWDVPELLKAKLHLMHERPWATIIPAYMFLPLSPWVKNYGLALCKVRIIPFTVGATLTFLSASLVEAAVGSSCASLAEVTEVDLGKKVNEWIATIW